MTFNAERTLADASVDCRFDSTVIQKVDANDPYGPGDRVTADGECGLGAIYEAGLWKLCTSSFDGDEVKLPSLTAERPRRGIAHALFGYRR